MNIFMNQWGSECAPEQLIYKEMVNAHREVHGKEPEISAVSFASDAGELIGHGRQQVDDARPGVDERLAEHARQRVGRIGVVDVQVRVV